MSERARAAAAVLLTRGEGAELEVYLVERAPELRFFGGYWALPGGVRGPEDGPDVPGAGDLPALARCAARELFEETGVLLGRVDLAAGERAAERRARLVEPGTKGEAPVTPHPGLLHTPAAVTGLRPVCRVETPPFAPVRYDTLFFHARLPAGEAPEVWPGELVAGRFWRPAAALGAWRRGEVLIVPPVLLLLELLESGDLAHFHAAAQATAAGYAHGKLHRVRFSPGVLMASVRTPTIPPATTTNCLVVGGERLFVVDPGTYEPSEQDRLFELLDELEEEGRRIAGVVLTHHHPDHIGAVNAVSMRYRVPLLAHPLTLARVPAGYLRGEPLQDGDRIELGDAPDGSSGWHLGSVFTPGHDRGHLCFRDSRYHAVLVGDMLSTISTIVIDPPEGHLRTYLQSLERLLAQPMSTLYPAHGPAMRDGHRLVRQYLRHRALREAALVGLLAEGPATVEELVPKVYWDTDPRMFPIAARSLLAGLEKLAEDGRARLVDGQWTRSGA